MIKFRVKKLNQLPFETVECHFSSSSPARVSGSVERRLAASLLQSSYACMPMCTGRCFQRRAGSGWRQWAGSDRTVGSRLANRDGLDVDGLLYPWTDVSTRPRRVYCLSNWLRQACDYTVPPVCCSEEHDSGSWRACVATGRMKQYTQEYIL